MSRMTKPTESLDWLVDEMVRRVAHTRQAVVLSSDGLAIGRSQELSVENADHLSAVAAGFHSLARSTSTHFDGGGVLQTIVEMNNGFLFVTAAGRGACLAVLTSAQADLGLVAYEMAMVVKRVGDHLSAAPRVPGDSVGRG
jgi:predicted regulator of Ras-like GTPase activity (Roadblock/LC7/MglB family)